MAVGLAVLPRLFRVGLPGTASVAAVPAAPRVGSCVDVGAETVVVVDCASVHDGEVVLQWPSGPDGRPAVIDPVACAEMVEPYPVDVAGEQLTGDWFARTGWVLVPGAATPVIARAPANQIGTRFDWSVCLITAGVAYAGKVGGADRSEVAPGAFRACEAATGQVSCARPHFAERLADKWDVLPHAATTTGVDRKQQIRETETASCLEFAAGVTGADDPTRGGRLTVEVTVEDTYPYDPELAPGVIAYHASCVVTSDRPLTASLVQFGPGPLPYA